MVRHTATSAVSGISPANSALVYWTDPTVMMGVPVRLDDRKRVMYALVPNYEASSFQSPDLVVVLPATGVQMSKVTAKFRSAVPEAILRLQSMCNVLRCVPSVNCPPAAAAAAAPEHDPVLERQAGDLLGSICFICSDTRACASRAAVQCPVCLMAAHTTCIEVLAPHVTRDPPVPSHKFPSDHLPAGFSDFTCTLCKTHILHILDSTRKTSLEDTSEPPSKRAKM